MRREPLNKNARTQSAPLASSEVGWGLGREGERPRNWDPLPAPRNRKYGINFTSRGFGDKILKFYLLKYNKCSMLSKRCGVKFEIPQRKRRLCNARSASASQILNLG